MSSRPRIGITAWRRPLATPLGTATDLYILGVEYPAATVAERALFEHLVAEARAYAARRRHSA
ncbi:MAG: hypothetical protein AB7H93_07330 [Vicinamibacterales bacterium]